jgi:hypothetical protein
VSRSGSDSLALVHMSAAFRLAFTGGLLAAMWLAALPARADCVDNSGCKANRVCQDGHCVDASSVKPVDQTSGAPASPAVTPTVKATDTSPAATDDSASAVAAPAPAPWKPPASASTGRTLTLFGGVALAAGYVIGAIAGGVGTGLAASQTSEYGSGNTCAGSSALSFIPLVGPFMTLGSYPNHDVAAYNNGVLETHLHCTDYKGVVTGIVVTDEIIQIAGAAMLVTGLTLNATVAQSKSGSLILFPGAAGAPLGLTLRFTSF